IPVGRRTVLVLRFYEGLDVTGTAAALGCSTGNVKSQTARGLQALKAALGADGLAAFGLAAQTTQTPQSGTPDAEGGERP
ncbi:MAG: RNA polymerase sigma factor, partial [Nakamurella sp.]